MKTLGTLHAMSGEEAAVKDPMYIVLLLCGAGALALAVFEFLHRQWLAAVLLTVIGISSICMTSWSLWSLKRLEVPLDAPELAGALGQRIVMQATGAEIGGTLMWALGFLLTSVGLVEVPDALWTKWLTYPVAMGALLLFGLMVFTTMGEKLERVMADAAGIEVGTEVQGSHADREKIAWGQVGTVKRVRTYVRKTRSAGGGTALLRQELVLLDRAGDELLTLADPLDPPEQYRRFLESIPRWTGLPVQEETVGK